MGEEPIYRHDWPGLHIVVYGARIEVTKGTLLKKSTTIPTRLITGVAVTATGRVRVETAGGREEWTIGPSAGKLRDAILSTLT